MEEYEKSEKTIPNWKLKWVKENMHNMMQADDT
jgi:hypothetical protein